MLAYYTQYYAKYFLAWYIITRTTTIKEFTANTKIFLKIKS